MLWTSITRSLVLVVVISLVGVEGLTMLDVVSDQVVVYTLPRLSDHEPSEPTPEGVNNVQIIYRTQYTAYKNAQHEWEMQYHQQLARQPGQSTATSQSSGRISYVTRGEQFLHRPSYLVSDSSQRWPFAVPQIC